MTAGQWLNLASGERATHGIEVYLILKMQAPAHWPVGQPESTWNNKQGNFSLLLKLIYFYRNSGVTNILFVCDCSGIKIEMLQLFTWEISHLFLLIKSLSSYCLHLFYCVKIMVISDLKMNIWKIIEKCNLDRFFFFFNYI